MSFSSDVKNELARYNEENECCQLAELAALLRMQGTMTIAGKANVGINFSTENAAVARRVLTFIKDRSKAKTEVVVTRGKRLKKNNTYHVRVVPDRNTVELLTELGFLSDGVIRQRPGIKIARKMCCKRAYLRGAFLGGGSVSRPQGSYHLELLTANKVFAETLLKFMRSFDLSAKLTDRKNTYIIYLKEGDAITHFLQIIGAHTALLKFEDVRILKEMRNKVNRIVNCETANLEKTVGASFKQIENIKLIQEKMGLEGIPKELRELALARLENPEATLNELADLLANKVGKSGINHRFRKINAIAENLRLEKN
ncbi:DNA-binding protein WhiA [Selenomonadales bacterium OttesenSCG-928-I06]|nr:DNA-binding protein WhiA [Selenomonadales bacterium OttesenSCG-928-I06]